MKTIAKKKLVLSRQILRTLTADQLRDVDGGSLIPTAGCTTHGGPTDICTFGCPKK
jgi:hypothetical protein